MKNVQVNKDAKVNESANEVNNSLNNSKMEQIFKLNIDFNGVVNAENSVRMSNQPALERFIDLAANGYYLMLQPKNKRTREAYLWVTATKQGEDRVEFSLYINEEILNVVVSILVGKIIGISEINADDLEEFNSRITNFEYTLFIAERAQGRTMKKTYTTNGQKFSSYYKRGVIIYMPYLNPELKAYLNA